MSFVVRQISRTAAGREIVRPRVIDGDVLTIGRATTSDIHLADLAVTLDHATMRRIAADRLSVATAKSLPFTVNGRSVAVAEIALGAGAEIRFGSHRLLVSRDPGTGEPRIDVERVEALSDTSEARDEARAFSLAGKMPGKRPTAWLLALGVLALFLAWPVWTALHGQGVRDRGAGFHADASWSPGALSLAHRNLQDNCQACHVEPFVAVRDESCKMCHAGVHDHADPRRLAVAMPPPTLGGRVRIAFQSAFNVPQGRCVDCHLEHEGAGPMPPARQRFCADCHAALTDRLPDTRLRNAADFGTAHPQFAPLIPVDFDGPAPILRRTSLDADPKEDEGLKFPHALHLSATNAVAQMTRTLAARQGWGRSLGCEDCHTPDAAGAGFRPVEMEKSCQACHSLAFDRRDGVVRTLRHGDPRAVVADLRAYYAGSGPVRPAMLGGMARRLPGDGAAARTAADYYLAVGHSGGRASAAIAAVFSPGGACYDCHVITRADDPRTLDYAVHPVAVPDRYFSKGWFDHGAHASETCESCHAARTSASASDVLIPKIASCRACHGGENAHAKVPSSCAMCHDYHRGDGAPFAVKTRRDRTGGEARRGTMRFVTDHPRAFG